MFCWSSFTSLSLQSSGVVGRVLTQKPGKCEVLVIAHGYK